MNAGEIVVAVDGSDASAPALAFAVRSASDHGRALAGVFVIDAGWADFIGSDWQSAPGTRQGFLDYVRADQEAHAAAAKRQFEAATGGLRDCRFEVLVGDPADALAERMASADVAALVLGREAFTVCGRPSARRLAGSLAARVRQPITIL